MIYEALIPFHLLLLGSPGALGTMSVAVRDTLGSPKAPSLCFFFFLFPPLWNFWVRPIG